MPCFKGIDISIAIQPGAKEIREFPHPDGSSPGPFLNSAVPPSPQQSPSSTVEGNSRQGKITDSTISVYIPSVPGAQFCIQYAIERPPEPTGHVFFKVFMNGRNVTSWGTNPAVSSTGLITRALYEPCDRWHFRQDGVVLKRDGIESRSFYFAVSSGPTAVADDGGLIEIQVFRAKSRRRKAPVLGQYRSQDRYGIASPSGGLLECPEEAKYYDWVLKDPKHAPYASFRFHYREWTYIRMLNLVSDDDCLSVPSSRRILEQQESPILSGAQNLDGNEEDDASTCKIRDERMQRFEHHTEERSSKGAFSNNVLAHPRPSASETYETTRRISSGSSAPSITPSLLAYVTEHPTTAEDIECATATHVQVLLGMESPPPSEEPKKRPLPSLPKRSSSCYDGNSPPSSLSSESLEWLSTLAPGLDEAPVSGEPPTTACFLGTEATAELQSFGTLTLSEGEWMKGRGTSHIY